MCFLIPLFLIALFAPVIPAQFDTAYIPDIPDIPKYYPDDIQYYSDPTQHYTEEIQHYPDETQYYADVIKYNPDKPIVVPPIQSADDDATACQSDTHPDDGRATRACCRGSGEGRTRDGGFVKVNTCRKYSLEEADCKIYDIWCCVAIYGFSGISCRILTKRI